MTRFYSTPLRRASIAIVCLSLAALATSRWSAGHWVVMGSPAPTVTATKAAMLLTDVDTDGKADPGDTIRYTVSILSSVEDALNVHLADTPDAHTTLVGGSIVVSPLAFADTYASVGNMTLTSSAIALNCVANPLRAVTCNDATPSGGTLSGFGATQGTANGTVVNGTNPVTTSNGGTVVLNTDGTFVYNPAAGFEGADAFFYTLTNSAGSDNTQVTINVGGANGMVWFINAAAAAGTGRQANPFNALAAFNTANTGAGTNPAANDTVFLFEGAYTGPVTLLATQKFIGQDATASVPTLGGPSLQLGNAYPAINPTGTTVSIASAGVAITLGAGSTLAGFNVGNSTTAIAGTTAGTVNVREVGINTNGQALTIATSATFTNNATFTGFTSVTSTGGVNGISLNNATGTVNLGIGVLSGNSGNAFNVSAGGADINYGGTITNATALAVNITGKTGGTVSLSGGIPVANASSTSPRGISLTGNTGATINFTGGVALSTGANAAFTATGGGTVNVTQNNTTIINTLATTTATALNVANTTIGASGLTLRSINSTTASANSGIVLNNTGGSGGLTVTGTGSTGGSGGAISTKTSATGGISVTSTLNLSLSNMNVQSNSNEGIVGTGVNGFTLTGCSVTGNGAGNNRNGVLLTDTTNAVSFVNNTVTGNQNFNAQLTASGGSTAAITTVNVTGGTYSNSVLNGGFLIDLRNTATLGAAWFNGVTFSGNFSKGLQLQTSNNSVMGNTTTAPLGTWSPAPPNGSVTVIANTFTSNNVAASFESGGGTNGTGSVYYRLVNNTTITGSQSHAINFANGSDSSGGTFRAFVSGNVIGNAGVAASGSVTGNGMRFFMQGQQAAILTIQNNTIRQAPLGRGIEVAELGRPVANSGQIRLDVKVTGNDVNPQDSTGFPLYAIYVAADAQGTGTSGSDVRAEIHGNTVPTTAACDTQCSGSDGMIFYETVSGATGTHTGTLFQTGAGGSVSNEIATTNTGTAGKTCSVVNGGTLTLTGTPPNTVARLDMPRGVPGAVMVHSVLAALRSSSSAANPLPAMSMRAAQWFAVDAGRDASHRIARYVGSAVAEHSNIALNGLRAVTASMRDGLVATLEAAGPDVTADIPTLPAGKTVKVIFDVTVDNASAVQYTNSATVIGANFGAVTTNTVTTTSGTPTKLVITQVNSGASPQAGTAFSVVVQSQDVGSAAANVTTNTNVTLSLNSGTGTLGGTLTGTITAGSSSVTINGVTYTKAESGVKITATRTSGDPLTAGTSAAFTVTAGAVTQYLLTPATTRVIVDVADRITITPADANGNATTGSASVTIIGRNAADTADNPNVQVDADKNGTFGDAVVNTSAGAATFDIKNAVVESFKVKASDGPNSGVSATITTFPLATAGQVVISEFRFRGPSGVLDEYINFYNNTDSDILVGTNDGSAGWALAAADTVTRFTIPNGVLLRARGFYLATNNGMGGFSLGAYPAGTGGGTVGTGDIQYATDIPSSGTGAGIALFRSSTVLNLANRLDAVGYSTTDPLYHEGTGLPIGGSEEVSNLQYAFARNMITGVPKDTDDNAIDFVSLDTSGTLTGLGQQLGDPSPHTMASPLRRSQIVVTAIPATPSTVRDNRPFTWNISGGGSLSFPIGVLSVAKRFTNNTGQAVTRLRVRIVNMTTFPPVAGVADMRAIDATGTVTDSAGNTIVAGLKPTLLELPQIQPNGGGLNATLMLDTTGLPGGNLGVGATVDVHLLLGVVQTGSFRFFIMMEALP